SSFLGALRLPRHSADLADAHRPQLHAANDRSSQLRTPEEQSADLTERHDEIYGDAEVEGDRKPWEHHADRDRHEVSDDPREQFPFPAQFRRLAFGRVEVFAAGIFLEREAEDASQE